MRFFFSAKNKFFFIVKVWITKTIKIGLSLTLCPHALVLCSKNFQLYIHFYFWKKFIAGLHLNIFNLFVALCLVSKSFPNKKIATWFTKKKTETKSKY